MKERPNFLLFVLKLIPLQKTKYYSKAKQFVTINISKKQKKPLVYIECSYPSLLVNLLIALFRNYGFQHIICLFSWNIQDDPYWTGSLCLPYPMPLTSLWFILVFRRSFPTYGKRTHWTYSCFLPSKETVGTWYRWIPCLRSYSIFSISIVKTK